MDLQHPDPGGHFDSDTHRRVQAAVPNPDDEPLSAEAVFERVQADDQLHLDLEETIGILKDLEASGHSAAVEDGWQNTQSGFELLTGPPEGAI